jgi:hypothetical protein
MDAADLAMLTGFQGIPEELRPLLALVLLRRAADRFSAALEALRHPPAVVGNPDGLLLEPGDHAAQDNRALEQLPADLESPNHMTGGTS